ncbi:TadE/TadG family type IV pilus assembly protein [Streptomyces sp. MI02-7b]|uniref:TadE/TadG family type IV pilus assembly protein n=1 Tax=Streptomyces sp. MI02-7b TaxID=462941 RepID=UPI0029B5A137|nr:TadE/TadG family type IV pilus assembly protein [Streptomyces sp. MI02-7b]MDX3075882.1 TadE/TadG family type IV pilus assembly protein [Streptomyces sp. MI02-7b]
MTPAPREPRLHGDQGSEAIQAAIVTPLLIAFLCLAIAAGRLAVAGGKADAAAEDAARAASLQRTQLAAESAAADAATRSFADQGVRCASTDVNVDASGFTVPVGQVGYVTVTVRCTVDLSDLLLPGAPGSRTLTSTFTSVVDAFRARQDT